MARSGGDDAFARNDPNTHLPAQEQVLVPHSNPLKGQRYESKCQRNRCKALKEIIKRKKKNDEFAIDVEIINISLA
jgi:hypothetical protein